MQSSGATRASHHVDVLVIDDSELARRAMVRTLSRAGFTVAESPTPIGVTSIILRRAVQVVVIDVNMPALPGDKLATVFRKNPRLEHLKLVLVSGIDEDAIERLAREVCADAVVAKSGGPTALVRSVSALLR